MVPHDPVVASVGVPAALCHSILKGVAEQRIRECLAIPDRILKKLQEGRAFPCLTEEEFREDTAEEERARSTPRGPTGPPGTPPAGPAD